MKIISQDQNQMSLKDGNLSAIIFGVILIVGGGYFIYHIFSTTGASGLMWIGVAILILGLIFLLTATTISVTIDKTAGQIHFTKKRLLNGTAKDYAISDCLRVELRKSFRMNPGTRNANGMVNTPTETLSYQSVVIMKDGTELPLENVKSKGGSNIGGGILMGGTGKELAMANQVANFLGIPFQEVGPASAPTIGMGGINL